MAVEYSDDKTVVIAASAARLTISRYNQHYWRVVWHITYTADVEWASGQLFMSDAYLGGAFGLTNHTDRGGQQLIKLYGGSAAIPGNYLRYRNFLNIPGPGTGYDGDPNISIAIDEIIRNAVRQLILAKATAAQPST